ncbi:hypothetical protein HUW46_04462 [Amycolatopsis sp. CA-230715]|nr:hypothetical protein HUW46_04462 [Amycolatopsis sp. CA-230715]
MLLIADDASAPPMRCPEPMWAILVGEVDIDDAEPDYLRAVTWFSGSWVERYPATGPYDGDVVVRLTDPEDPALPLPRDAVVDVEMLLAHHGRWRRVGHWPAADHRWPHLIADTAATVMCLHGETGGTAVPDRSGDVAAARPARAVLSRPRRNNSLLELVVAGLLSPGDEFVWDRPRLLARHVVRIGAHGEIILADGQSCATPTQATNALGGSYNNGWNVFRRVSDERTLSDLRAMLQERRGY